MGWSWSPGFDGLCAPPGLHCPSGFKVGLSPPFSVSIRRSLSGGPRRRLSPDEVLAFHASLSVSLSLPPSLFFSVVPSPSLSVSVSLFFLVLLFVRLHLTHPSLSTALHFAISMHLFLSVSLSLSLSLSLFLPISPSITLFPNVSLFLSLSVSLPYTSPSPL